MAAKNIFDGAQTASAKGRVLRFDASAVNCDASAASRMYHHHCMNTLTGVWCTPVGYAKLQHGRQALSSTGFPNLCCKSASFTYCCLDVNGRSLWLAHRQPGNCSLIQQRDRTMLGPQRGLHAQLGPSRGRCQRRPSVTCRAAVTKARPGVLSPQQVEQFHNDGGWIAAAFAQ
jgi:hypothetical protein